MHLNIVQKPKLHTIDSFHWCVTQPIRSFLPPEFHILWKYIKWKQCTSSKDQPLIITPIFPHSVHKPFNGSTVKTEPVLQSTFPHLPYIFPKCPKNSAALPLLILPFPSPPRDQSKQISLPSITTSRATRAHPVNPASRWSALWSLWVFPKETKDYRFVEKHDFFPK